MYQLGNGSFVRLFSDSPEITHIMIDTIVSDTDKVTLDCRADGYTTDSLSDENKYLNRVFF